MALAVIVIASLASAAWYYSKLRNNTKHHTVVGPSAHSMIMTKLKPRAFAMEAYAKRKGFNTSICFMVDMSMESGRNRFFMYDLVHDSVIDAGLVTHGRCNANWLQGRQYSNTVGGGCTSLGKYKIGKPYQGKFGLAYKLYGLDSTNNNAFKRFVVLHAHSCVPEGEVDPYPICQSDGCPTVSPGFLKKLAATIDRSSRPVLLCIFE
jgi:hypothetical protein